MIKTPLICAKGTADTVFKCNRIGVIDSSDSVKKRIALFNRSDVNLKLLAMTYSKDDKTWEIITYPEGSDGYYTVIGFDDSGVYNADIVDKLSLFNKTFTYSDSELKAIGESEIIQHRVFTSVNRLIRQSFFNWLMPQQSITPICLLTNSFPPSTYTNVQSVIFDFENCYAGATCMGMRRIEFYDETGALIPLTTSGGLYTVYFTSQYDTTNYKAEFAFNTSLSKIGAYLGTQWLSASGQVTNQRLVCVFATARTISKIVINSGHNLGGTLIGARQTRIAVTSDTLNTAVYDAALTNHKLVFFGELPNHVAADIADNYTLPFQTYQALSQSGVKSVVIDIKNNHGNASYMSIRRVDFYDLSFSKIPLLTTDFTAYSTSQYSTSYTATMAFTTALSKTGSWLNTGWVSLTGTMINQRLVCFLNTAKDISMIVINNNHDSGNSTSAGVKETKIYTSTSETVPSNIYESPIVGSTLVFDGTIPIHPPVDAISNYIIKGYAAPKLTDLTRTELIPSTVNAYPNYTLIGVDDSSYKITAIIGNELTLSESVATDTVTPIKSITPAIPSGTTLVYTGAVDPYSIQVESGSSIPVLKGDSLSSVAVSETKTNTVLEEGSAIKTYYIVIDNTKIDTTLTNFPLTIQLTEPLIFTLIGSNYQQFKVETREGVKCYVEVEMWDSVNNKAVIHIKTPSVSDTQDTILILSLLPGFNNPDYIGLAGTVVAQSVWDSNYKAVYTMAQDPSLGTITDSTTNAKHGTPYGAMTSANLVDGLTGKAIIFDGVNDYVTAPFEGISGEGSLEALYSRNSLNKQEVVLAHGVGVSGTTCLLVGNKATSNTMYMQLTGTLKETWLDPMNISPVFVANEFRYIGFTSDTIYGKSYTDGILGQTHNAISCSYSVNTGALHIGMDNRGVDYLAGKIEHIRISDIARSDAWIKATNYSLRNQLATVSAVSMFNTTISTTKVEDYLYNFPISVNLSASSGLTLYDISDVFNYSYDSIYIEGQTDLLETVFCPVEVESWDAVNKKSTIHFKAPCLSPLADNVFKLIAGTPKQVSRLGNRSNFMLLSNTTDGSTTFVDSSENAYPIAVTGTVTHQTAQKKLAASSIYLNGTSTIGINSGVSFGTSDFTMHLWWRRTSIVQPYPSILSNRTNTWAANNWYLADSNNGSGKFECFTFNSPSYLIGTTTVLSGVWYHVAVTRKGNILRLFVNGIKEAEVTYTQSIDGGIPTQLKISGTETAAINGHVDGVSVTVGECLWEANFTPPITTAEYTQVPIYYTGMTGSKEAQAVWDNNFKAVYTMAQDPTTGNRILDSTRNNNHGTPKGGMTSANLIDGLTGKALTFDGVDDYISVPNSTSLNITDNITLETLIKNYEFSNNGILSKSSLSSEQPTYGLTVTDTVGAYYGYGLRLNQSITEGAGQSTGGTLTANAYDYIAGSYDKTNLILYQNALPVKSTGYTSSLNSNTSALNIGAYYAAGFTFLGIIDHIRISNIARSTAWIKTTNYSLKDTLLSIAPYGGMLITPTDIYYSISFDDKNTYKIWTGTEWRAIASKLDTVHGVTGDSSWYFRDNEDVWSKTGIIQSASSILSKAMTYTNNKMTSTILNALTSTEYDVTGGFTTASGFFDIAITLVSSLAGVGATIDFLNVNSSLSDVLFMEPINIETSSTIAGSNIRWNYPVITGYDFATNIQIYAHVTGESQWSLCTNGSSIPQITSGMTTTGKKLYIKAVMTKLSGSPTVDPALFMIDITIN